MRKALLYFILSLLINACVFSQKDDYYNYDIPLSKLLDSLEMNSDDIQLLIDKSDYKLSVLFEDKIIKEYPVVFGGNAKDDKLMEGDQCTPEGIFHMNSKYPHKDWSKFIWLDYPTNDSWKKHNKAKSEGMIPKDAKIGGEIGIHGVPDGFDIAIDLHQNWTLGCVSLKNKDINEIYPYINKETIIKIQK